MRLVRGRRSVRVSIRRSRRISLRLSRIDQLEASGQISRAEAAQAKAEAEAKTAQAAAAEAAQFAQIDAQMGLTPGTAQAMSAGGLLGDLYGDHDGEPGG